MKPAGSTVPVVARWSLEGIGTSFDKVKAKGGSLTQVDVSQIPQLMRDGADLYFESPSPGHPATTEVSLTVDVRFLDVPEKSLQLLAKNGLKIWPMPQFFKGQKGPVKSVDFGTNLIAHKDLSDDLAYRITKAICENRMPWSPSTRPCPDSWPRTRQAGERRHPAPPRVHQVLHGERLGPLSPRRPWSVGPDPSRGDCMSPLAVVRTLVAVIWFAFQMHIMLWPMDP